MEMTSLIIVGVVVLVAIITIIGILSRYRKCKSDELLVVYGKTGSHKEKVSERDAKGNLVDREVEIKTAKVYHGGAAFVWPIIQGYEVMSMQPIQLNLVLKNALSAQNIRVTIPTTVTVAISQEPLIMQNAANRLLGADDDVKESLISDIVYGQMRLVIASMTIEELNSDRDKFLAQARDNINTELNKLGLYLMNISDIQDAAQYIDNLGKKEETKARAQSQADIAEEEKEVRMAVAAQNQEAETVKAQQEKEAKTAQYESEARQKAAKILKAAEAKANATKMQLEAEAEGKKASLMAEAEQKQAMEMAPALAVEHMIKSGMHPEAIVQYAMTDRWKEVAEANAKVFEHIQLGNVTVYGDSNTAGQFMANMAKNLAPSLEIARNLPIADSLKQIITGKKPEESPAKGDNFPPVK